MTTEEIKKSIPDFLRNSETYLVVITDLEGKYIYVNELFKIRFAFMNLDFIGQPFSITIHPDDVDACNLTSYECITNPEKPVKVQVRKPIKDLSDYYWTNWEFSLFKDQNHQPIGILCIGHDITETQRLSNLNKEFAQKVETIIEEITDGFYVLDHEWKFIKINKVAEQIFGVPREKLLGQKIWDIFPDTPEYNYPTQIRKAMNEYVTTSFEDFLSDLDRWFSTVCYPSQEGLTVFFKDITQEKRAREKLKNSENKLRAILDSSVDNNLLISPEYKILCYNKQADNDCQITLGKSLEELADIWDYILPEHKEDFYNDSQKALQGHTLKFESEIKFEKLSVWYDIMYIPVYDRQENMLGFTFSAMNIDERKQKEFEIEENKNRVDKILESVPQPLVIVNKHKSITYTNRAFEKVFGYSQNEILQKKIDILIPERFKNTHQQHEKKYIDGGGKFLHKTSEYVSGITKDHVEISLNASLNTFFMNNEQFVIVILEDITELKRRQDIILRQNEALQQIAWDQAHKVRQPVANILGLIDILENDKSLMPEEKEQCLNYVFQATQQLDKIIQRIVVQSNESEHNEDE